MPNNSDKPSSIGKRKGGFLFASASDRNIDLQQGKPDPQITTTDKTVDFNQAKNMSLSSTLKERLSQYKALKEEEQRHSALADTPAVTGKIKAERSTDVIFEPTTTQRTITQKYLLFSLT